MTGISSAKAIDGPVTVGGDFGRINAGKAEHTMEVCAGSFEDFEEPVFEFNVVVGAGETKAGGCFEWRVVVEFSLLTSDLRLRAAIARTSGLKR